MLLNNLAEVVIGVKEKEQIWLVLMIHHPICPREVKKVLVDVGNNVDKWERDGEKKRGKVILWIPQPVPCL